MKTKLDFDDIVENALNEENSEKNIVAEYVENEIMEQGLEKLSLMKRITGSYTDIPCCSKNCCGMWEKDNLKKHVEDLEKLSKTEKKIVLSAILRNNAINTESTRYSEQRRRLRFSFRYEPFGKMCATAFRLLFDIRIEAFKGLLAHLKTSGMSVVPPAHGNKGKPVNKADMLTNRGVIEKLVVFMSALAEAQGEFSPGRDTKSGSSKEDQNPDTLWLPACFTRSAILRMYH